MEDPTTFGNRQNLAVWQSFAYFRINETERNGAMRIGITCYPTYGGSGVVATELGIELAATG
ncbi:MAG TPA: hypothetical protein VK716_03420, partial [Terracidiphilus sp.]|nr:hypothetical protein [Terracidiphilus sp.]